MYSCDGKYEFWGAITLIFLIIINDENMHCLIFLWNPTKMLTPVCLCLIWFNRTIILSHKYDLFQSFCYLHIFFFTSFNWITPSCFIMSLFLKISNGKFLYWFMLQSLRLFRFGCLKVTNLFGVFILSYVWPLKFKMKPCNYFKTKHKVSIMTDVYNEYKRRCELLYSPMACGMSDLTIAFSTLPTLCLLRRALIFVMSGRFTKKDSQLLSLF